MKIQLKPIWVAYKIRNPKATQKEVAPKLFPDKSESRAALFFGHLLSGKEGEMMYIKDIGRICDFFNVEPNDFIK